MLSLVHKIAGSGLGTQSELTSVASRNIVSASDPAAVRKKLILSTSAFGGVQAGSVVREANLALASQMRNAAANVARSDVVVQGLQQIGNVIGAAAGEMSPAAKLGALQTALIQFAAAPQDQVASSAVVEAARELADSLVQASAEVQSVRRNTDGQIAGAVDTLRKHLETFGGLNAAIVDGIRSGRDVTDQQDRRDQLLLEMSQYVSLRTIVRENDDMVILTQSGATLFETVARDIAFAPSGTLASGASGGQVLIDGLPLVEASNGIRGNSGQIAGLLRLRDDLTATIQVQLDEVARGLISVFAEADQSGLGGPPHTGLFTFVGASGLPPEGVVMPGLASRITVNPAADPTLGGDPTRLRNGGMTGPDAPAYTYNVAGEAGFSDRLNALVDGFAGERAFDTSAGLGGMLSLLGFSEQSIGWLEEHRRNAAATQAGAAALAERSAKALSNATGINLDLEMAELLEVERSYQATARLLATVDAMFNELFAATR
jgi:flagellar hook-associated protein 1